MLVPGRAWRSWTACCARCSGILTVDQDCSRTALPAFRAAGWALRKGCGWICPACNTRRADILSGRAPAPGQPPLL